MERRRAVAAAASRPLVAVLRVALLVASIATIAPTSARADSPLADDRILDAPSDAIRLRSVTLLVTGFDQFGYGYQSKAGPTMGPGSERETIFEPEVEIVATQGDRLTHRLWVPVDLVTNASPHAPDVTTQASQQVQGGSVDWTTTYRANPKTDVSIRGAIHLEEPFRSWTSGIGVRRSLADDATVISASLLAAFDWFDRFSVDGTKNGRADRSSSTGSLALTQVLTPTTVANVSYGITSQDGELGNAWNIVPLASGSRGSELLPTSRTRSALVGRASQWLPWNGALRLYYRLYADSWGIVAHSMEGQLMQRITPELYVGGYYRFHTQSGASFFTTLAPLDATFRTADSDLAPLDSQTVGGKIVVDLPTSAGPYGVRGLHFELACERYFRTNDLQVNIVSWATGFRF
jgi:hypothetical protein